MVKTNLEVNIGKLKLKNPVIAASGTFGYAEEYKDLVDINKLGAVITKSITLKPRKGNPPPRVIETPQGMLNAIGLQNEGVENFIAEKLLVLKKLKTARIVSIAGEAIEEFGLLAQRLDKIEDIDAIEINISCPNIKYGERLFSQEPQATYDVTKRVREATGKVIIVKLSPNVTDITEIAKAAENAGADAVSAVNTFTAMVVDIKTKKPFLANITGGLSGPAIKPIALRMVREIVKKVNIPVIGMGGIMNADDAIEFLLCGAKAVEIGTANFVNPKASVEIIKGIENYLKNNKISDINKIIGAINEQR